MRLSFLVPVTVAVAGVSPSATLAQPAQSMAETPKLVTTPIVRTGRTASNQPLKLPQGEAEMVAVAVDIPVGGATPIHQHPWQRIVYVEKGPLQVVNHDTGETRDFQSGTVLPEVVAQWHEGRAPSQPVRLIVIDLVPPGVSNMVMKPAHEM